MNRNERGWYIKKRDDNVNIVMLSDSSGRYFPIDKKSFKQRIVNLEASGISNELEKKALKQLEEAIK